jgi:hypothetical protein
MANYKRGKCRYNGKCRRSSQSFIRKRLGLKVKTLTFEEAIGDAKYPSAEYFERRLAYYQHRDWPEWYKWHGSMPRHWNLQHHTRPRRVRERVMQDKVRTGWVDAEEAIWPLSKKPHIYYW